MISAGTSFTLSASASIFRASDVGAQIWQSYDANGNGGGRATITRFTSPTKVTMLAVTDFDETIPLIQGKWEFATKIVENADLFDGLTVDIQADGGGHPSQPVIAGKVNLNYWASRVFLGFGYVGRLVTQNLSGANPVGQTQAKPRNMKRVRARFVDTIAARVGPDEYSLPEVVFNKTAGNPERVPAPFSGIKDLGQLDRWNPSTKQGVVIQNQPTSCTVIGLDMEIYTVDPP